MASRAYFFVYPAFEDGPHKSLKGQEPGSRLARHAMKISQAEQPDYLPHTL
jgi:hypothetical protein